MLIVMASAFLVILSWVIPDGTWSDHAGIGTDIKGPAWVAAIVNAVGTANRCGNESYWNDTVILITWDDWGGWYDHVLPWNCNNVGVCSGYPNNTGQQYVYGFRVPLLVVSAYAKQGYISGACEPPNCPNEQQQYIHDFGSILNFIEYAFGTGGKSLGSPYGIGPQQYPYADYFAPDGPRACGSKCPYPYSLSDFFNFSQTATTFQPIVLPPVLCNSQVCYNAEWFENFNGTPSDPDDDGEED